MLVENIGETSVCLSLADSAVECAQAWHMVHWVTFLIIYLFQTKFLNSLKFLVVDCVFKSNWLHGFFLREIKTNVSFRFLCFGSDNSSRHGQLCHLSSGLNLPIQLALHPTTASRPGLHRFVLGLVLSNFSFLVISAF